MCDAVGGGDQLLNAEGSPSSRVAASGIQPGDTGCFVVCATAAGAYANVKNRQPADRARLRTVRCHVDEIRKRQADVDRCSQRPDAVVLLAISGREVRGVVAKGAAKCALVRSVETQSGIGRTSSDARTYDENTLRQSRQRFAIARRPSRSALRPAGCVALRRLELKGSERGDGLDAAAWQ
jgi:hypothetical protein